MSQAHAAARHTSDLDALVSDARAGIPTLVANIVADIRASVSAYAGPEGGERQRVITLAVTAAAHQFLDTLAGPTHTDPRVTKLFRDMGFGELQDGHSLDPMRRALRIATRHAWRTLHAYVREHEASVDFLGRIGDALLAYMDHLDQEVERGHLIAKTQGDSRPEQIRERLLDALLLDAPHSDARLTEVKAEAESANWELPKEITVLRISHHGDFPAIDLGDKVLTRFTNSPALVLCASEDAEALSRRISRAAAGLRVAVSWPLLPTQGAAADRWARRALELVDAGVIQPDPIIRCRDQATNLWLHAEPVLRQQLTQELLTPLLAETANSREILSETMLAWLESRDSAPAIASKLNVHPQTVRYRWKRINELFGDLLHDPDYVVSVTMLLKATVPLWKAGDLTDIESFRAAQGAP